MNTSLIDMIPDWSGSLAEQLFDALDEREISYTDLSELSGVCSERLKAFLAQQLPELTPQEYHRIETALDFPENYFARLKTLYEERKNPLTAAASSQV